MRPNEQMNEREGQGRKRREEDPRYEDLMNLHI